VDEFQFNYSSQERPHIQNDSVTLPRRTAADHRTKLAISYALAQRWAGRWGRGRRR
jgi:uncharacterized Rmd1/YagE family protein